MALSPTSKIFINRKKLVLKEISSSEYTHLKDRLTCPTTEPDPFDGVARITREIRLPKHRLFAAFKETRGARRVCAYNGWEWIRKSLDELDEEAITRFLEIAEDKNLIYLEFHNNMPDNSISDEIGFRLIRGKPYVASVYVCIPGERRHQKCTWQGSEVDYPEIHGIV